MQYVPFGKHGFDVSRLGFGCMRLPTVKDGDRDVIDREKAIGMIRHGIDGGITYVDTAYPYHGGESEIVVGLALKEGYRDKVTLTTKLPVWAVNEEKDMNRLLDEQLKKLDVPYVDFYLLHAMDKSRMDKMQAFHYKDFFKQAVKDVSFSIEKTFRPCMSRPVCWWRKINCSSGWSRIQIGLEALGDWRCRKWRDTLLT